MGTLGTSARFLLRFLRVARMGMKCLIMERVHEWAVWDVCKIGSAGIDGICGEDVLSSTQTVPNVRCLCWEVFGFHHSFEYAHGYRC